jgi:K+-sensing histidine kinase KdpD
MMRTLFELLHRSLTHRYAAVFLAATITGIIQLFDPMLGMAMIAMVFLLGVLIVATTAGLVPGTLISLLSFLAFNFFFVAPPYTFHAESAQDVLHLVMFLAVAITASSLAARTQRSRPRGALGNRAIRTVSAQQWEVRLLWLKTFLENTVVAHVNDPSSVFWQSRNFTGRSWHCRPLYHPC